MPVNDRILTLHPEAKKGKNILRSKYDITRDCLIGIFADYPEISHKELTRLSKERLSDRLEGNTSWYMETVLLDLMARGMILKNADKPVVLKIIETGI
jgi:predicted transglutaminase-like protease